MKNNFKEQVLALIDERVIEIKESCEDIRKHCGTNNIGFAMESGGLDEIMRLRREIEEME